VPNRSVWIEHRTERLDVLDAGAVGEVAQWRFLARVVPARISMVGEAQNLLAQRRADCTADLLGDAQTSAWFKAQDPASHAHHQLSKRVGQCLDHPMLGASWILAPT
jgi:hypothetical protein